MALLDHWLTLSPEERDKEYYYTPAHVRPLLGVVESRVALWAMRMDFPAIKPWAEF